MSKSFYGMRQRKDVMHLKALHGSFNLLSETIGAAIDEVLSHASLITAQHQAINALVDKQHHLASMNAVLDNLGRELSRMAEQDSTRTLSEIAVEWLDAILLTLKDLAQEYNDADFALLDKVTSRIVNKLLHVPTVELKRRVAEDGPQNHLPAFRSLFGIESESESEGNSD